MLALVRAQAVVDQAKLMLVVPSDGVLRILGGGRPGHPAAGLPEPGRSPDFCIQAGGRSHKVSQYRIQISP